MPELMALAAALPCVEFACPAASDSRAGFSHSFEQAGHERSNAERIDRIFERVAVEGAGVDRCADCLLYTSDAADE